MKNKICSIVLIFSLFAACSSCSLSQYVMKKKSVTAVSSNSKPVSHELWDGLLRQYVAANGKVDYKGFLRDSSRFRSYLDLLGSHHPNDANWTKKEQLAYWINAYNAFTVKLICDHYPVASIKDIKNGIPFVNTVWDIKFIKIEGATYDLNNIEHGIIRAKLFDPRIHCAVNCASVSCPRLLAEAFTAEKLDAQLDFAVRDFLKDRSKNVLSADAVQLSNIFNWYQPDFKKSGTLIDFLNQYTVIKINPTAKISYLTYDWNLNGL